MKHFQVVMPMFHFWGKESWGPETLEQTGKAKQSARNRRGGKPTQIIVSTMCYAPPSVIYKYHLICCSTTFRAANLHFPGNLRVRKHLIVPKIHTLWGTEPVPKRNLNTNLELFIIQVFFNLLAVTDHSHKFYRIHVKQCILKFFSN